MATYKLSTASKADLREIYRHGYFNFGETRADEYFQALFERFEQIAREPMLYQAVDHIRAGYRRSVCGVHSIYYCINDESVEIMHILGQQDTKRHIAE